MTGPVLDAENTETNHPDQMSRQPPLTANCFQSYNWRQLDFYCYLEDISVFFQKASSVLKFRLKLSGLYILFRNSHTDRVMEVTISTSNTNSDKCVNLCSVLITSQGVSFCEAAWGDQTKRWNFTSWTSLLLLGFHVSLRWLLSLLSQTMFKVHILVFKGESLVFEM